MKNYIYRDGIPSVSCLFRMAESDITCRVYRPCSNVSCMELWEELKTEIQRSWKLPWCIEGDFNVIQFPHERTGSRLFSHAEFNDFITEMALVDQLLVGGLLHVV